MKHFLNIKSSTENKNSCKQENKTQNNQKPQLNNVFKNSFNEKTSQNR